MIHIPTYHKKSPDDPETDLTPIDQRDARITARPGMELYHEEPRMLFIKLTTNYRFSFLWLSN